MIKRIKGLYSSITGVTDIGTGKLTQIKIFRYVFILICFAFLLLKIDSLVSEYFFETNIMFSRFFGIKGLICSIVFIIFYFLNIKTNKNDRIRINRFITITLFLPTIFKTISIIFPKLYSSICTFVSNIILRIFGFIGTFILHTILTFISIVIIVWILYIVIDAISDYILYTTYKNKRK